MAARRAARIRTWLMAQIVLLGAQLLLGMAVNLWVAVPARHPGAGATNYFAGLIAGLWWALLHGGTLLTGHIALGATLWVVSIGIVVASIRRGPRGVGVWALIAWTGLTGAGFNGGSFVNYGHAVSSFLMVAGWLLAAVASLAAWNRCRTGARG